MRPSTREVREAVTAVVEAQLAALRRDDVAEAYRHASAPLRAQTPLPAFVRMLQQSYREIWRNERATFALVRDDGERATVTVRVSGAAGEASFDYLLAREKSEWRIAGVVRRAIRPEGAL